MAKGTVKGSSKLVGEVASRLIDTASKGGSTLLGKAAGVVAVRIARRSPVGAILIGGAYVAHKLYQRHKEREDDARASKAKPAKVAPEPSLPPSTRG